MSLENDDPNNEKGNVVVDRKKAKVEVESSDEEMDVDNEELLAEVFFLNLFLHFVVVFVFFF